MTRIAKAFARGKAFVGFITAGDPSTEASEKFVLEMAGKGADLIELGIPFSDPIAEGPVIQAANVRALKAGTSLEKIFLLVERLRTKTEVPLVFLSYFNPIFHYGCDAFFKRCRQSGVDGIIIPDMPFEEHGEALTAAKEHGVDFISLIAPTSEDRIKEIAGNAQSFIYIVSSLGVTGVRRELKSDLRGIISTVRKYSPLPCAVGFGISTPEQALAVSSVADGVIVGSAIVKIVAEHGENAALPLGEYVKKMKSAMSAGAK